MARYLEFLLHCFVNELQLPTLAGKQGETLSRTTPRNELNWTEIMSIVALQIHEKNNLWEWNLFISRFLL